MDALHGSIDRRTLLSSVRATHDVATVIAGIVAGDRWELAELLDVVINPGLDLCNILRIARACKNGLCLAIPIRIRLS